MPILTDVQLTAIGSRAALDRFARSDWPRLLSARYIELLQNEPKRRAWRYQTEKKAVCLSLGRISMRFQGITFLLDFDDRRHSIKGIAKAKNGMMESCCIPYA